MTTDDQDWSQPDVTQRMRADDPPTSPLAAISDPHTQQFAAAVDPDPHAEFRRQAAEHFKAAQPEPHTEVLRQTPAHFGGAPATPYGQPASDPGTGQSQLDLRPWHAAAVGGMLCLLFALVASSSFGWIVLAVLCAAAAWYLKSKDVAWPPTVRDTLVRHGLTKPTTTALGGVQAPRALADGQKAVDVRPWHAASAAGALCLLIALFAASFAWFVFAVLCAAGAWYLKTKNVAWPSTLREPLIRNGLTSPTAAADTHPPTAPLSLHIATSRGGANKKPGGGAAMTAALLALALGLYWALQTYDLWRTVVQFSGASVPGTGGLKATVIVEAVVSTATTIALLVGGARLLNRNARGRAWIAFGCVVVLADAAATWITLSGVYSMGLSTVPSIVSSRLFESVVHSQDELKTWALIITALTLLTLVLAWSKATGQWCAEGTPTVRWSPVVAGIGVAALVALVAAIGAHSAKRAYESATVPTTPTTTTTASSAADSTSLAIKNATVNSCIHRVMGAPLSDGTSSLTTLWATSCSSSDATDVVTKVTDSTSLCGSQWVQTKTFGQPIVLCLRRM